jgi:hypothetical protein
MMGTSFARWTSLSCAALIIFSVTVVIGLQLLPGPHSEMDFLVIGCIATLLSLTVLFAMLLATWMKSPNPFFRRRLKPTAAADPPQNR